MPQPTHPYVRTWEGWLYLATVLDVFSRRVIGWALMDHPRASLVCDVLRMAVHTVQNWRSERKNERDAKALDAAIAGEPEKRDYAILR